MNYIVSGYVYFVAFTLVLYMISSLVTGVLGVAAGLMDISSSAKVILSSAERGVLELQLLHTIAADSHTVARQINGPFYPAVNIKRLRPGNFAFDHK